MAECLLKEWFGPDLRTAHTFFPEISKASYAQKEDRKKALVCGARQEVLLAQTVQTFRVHILPRYQVCWNRSQTACDAPEKYSSKTDPVN